MHGPDPLDERLGDAVVVEVHLLDASDLREGDVGVLEARQALLGEAPLRSDEGTRSGGTGVGIGPLRGHRRRRMVRRARGRRFEGARRPPRRGPPTTRARPRRAEVHPDRCRAIAMGKIYQIGAGSRLRYPIGPMRVFDCHVHVQPWEQLHARRARPDGRQPPRPRRDPGGARGPGCAPAR